VDMQSSLYKFVSCGDNLALGGCLAHTHCMSDAARVGLRIGCFALTLDEMLSYCCYSELWSDVVALRREEPIFFLKCQKVIRT
jgi:hypothetical protein